MFVLGVTVVSAKIGWQKPVQKMAETCDRCDRDLYRKWQRRTESGRNLYRRWQRLVQEVAETYRKWQRLVQKMADICTGDGRDLSKKGQLGRK